MQAITPFLYLNGNAQEAADFYVDVFKAELKDVMRYGDAGPRPKGSLMVATVSIRGSDLILLNGGPEFALTPAISLFVRCDTQAEVDHLWARLTEGGREIQCGWLTDKFGVTWQVVPNGLMELMRGSDAAAVKRMMQAMFAMKKLDLPALRAAYDGRAD